MDISNLRFRLEEEYKSEKMMEGENYLQDVIENRIGLNEINSQIN